LPNQWRLSIGLASGGVEFSLTAHPSFFNLGGKMKRRKIVVNPQCSFLNKCGAYVFYFDFNFTFFEGESAVLIKRLLPDSLGKIVLRGVPKEFVRYLLGRGILKEVV
jgi:hypothetical protein